VLSESVTWTVKRELDLDLSAQHWYGKGKDMDVTSTSPAFQASDHPREITIMLIGRIFITTDGMLVSHAGGWELMVAPARRVGVVEEGGDVSFDSFLGSRKWCAIARVSHIQGLAGGSCLLRHMQCGSF